MKPPLKSSHLTSDGDESTSEEESQNESSEQYDSEEEWNGITQNEPTTTSGQELVNEVEITILKAARPSSMLHLTECIATLLTRLQAPTYLHICETPKILIRKPSRSSQSS